ncbi:macro domain-containing protein [Actinoplanes sp. NPDC049548]|uniref:macro domain-containing protein n=1 Tax=Actinoplanes sp. NPDC049548 TaxID=3155152 RepID=UPI00341BE142
MLTVQHSDVRTLPPSRDGERRRIGVVTGDLRQVRGADIWINSENTDMVMARVQERSVSAIIRYEGASRDAAGRVLVDHIANELEAKVAGLRPIGPGGVVVTGAGDLSRYGVRHVIHAAAVHGAPGAGFQPIKEMGRCVANALEAAETVTPDGHPATVLFPLLGCGDAGGAVTEIAPTLIHTAVNHLRVAANRVGCVLFLAWTQEELTACQDALNAATDAHVPAQRATASAAANRSVRVRPKRRS